MLLSAQAMKVIFLAVVRAKGLKHAVRLTNYSNPNGGVLALSNVKRAGFANRVGRVGLPIDAPDTAVNVNCGKYYNTFPDRDNKGIAYSHSWYFDSAVNGLFMQDLYATIKGDIDRDYMPTCEMVNSELFLVPFNAPDE